MAGQSGCGQQFCARKQVWIPICTHYKISMFRGFSKVGNASLRVLELHMRRLPISTGIINHRLSFVRQMQTCAFESTSVLSSASKQRPTDSIVTIAQDLYKESRVDLKGREGGLPGPAMALSPDDFNFDENSSLDLDPESFLGSVYEILQASNNGTLVFPRHTHRPLLRAIALRIKTELLRRPNLSEDEMVDMVQEELFEHGPRLVRTHEEAINIMFPYAPQLGESVVSQCFTMSRFFHGEGCAFNRAVHFYLLFTMNYPFSFLSFCSA